MNTAEFQNSKIELAKMVLNIESEAQLEKFRSFFKEADTDWWDDLGELQKEDFRKAEEDIEKGRTQSLNEFIKKIS